MRVYLLPIAASVFALGAFVVAAFAPGGRVLALTLAVAAATCFVAIATLSLYWRPVRVKEIPLENFSLWTDEGEPAAGLGRFSAGEFAPAMGVARADLGALASNSELLSSRTSMLVGRPGFEEISGRRLDLLTGGLAHDLERLVERLGSVSSPEGFRELLSRIEGCATQADRIANKLFEFARGKPEIARAYIEPLRRAAEKLSRDLRLAHLNIAEYSKTLGAPSPQAPPAGA